MTCVFPSSQSQTGMWWGPLGTVDYGCVSATGEEYELLRETVAAFLDWNAYSRVDLARVFPVL